MQKLLTKELQKKLPPLYSQDGKKAETVVYGHWFSCFNGWDFYATEYDEETGDMSGSSSGQSPRWATSTWQSLRRSTANTA